MTTAFHDYLDNTSGPEPSRRQDRMVEQPSNDWAEIIAGNEGMTAAILDRLLHRCHVFNIKGRSYRLKELEGSLKQ